MRLWSLHPSYLDQKGLVALWREGLLAKKVLSGQTKGYRHHPQLTRFRAHHDPLAVIDCYLLAVREEASRRGYLFVAGDLPPTLPWVDLLPVTDGQLAHERDHLAEKLTLRAREQLVALPTENLTPHPLFTVVPGAVEVWERVYDSQRRFPYERDFAATDFREHPEQYRVGRGEEGVLLVEPYKSEILPFWRFKTPDVARASADTIYKLFKKYKRAGDFVGMDMARKFLQMGYTRARRYANHPSGRKYEKNPQQFAAADAEASARTHLLPQAPDWNINEKAESARVFYSYYLKAREDPLYQSLKQQWVTRYG